MSTLNKNKGTEPVGGSFFMNEEEVVKLAINEPEKAKGLPLRTLNKLSGSALDFIYRKRPELTGHLNVVR